MPRFLKHIFSPRIEKNLVIFAFYVSTQNHAKISNQNKLRNVPAIKILYDNLKKALFVRHCIGPVSKKKHDFELKRKRQK